MFTKTALILALVDLAAAAPAVTNKPTSPVPNTNRYTAIASHSGSPIQNLGIAANGRNFYINKGTSSYCPSPPIDCSNYENNHNQAFIRTDGSLGFNGPHSISVPEGAVYCPFQYAPQTQESIVGKLTFEGLGFREVHALSAALEKQEGWECGDFTIATAIWAGENPYEYS